MAKSKGLAKQRREATKLWLKLRVPLILCAIVLGALVAAKFALDALLASRAGAELARLEETTQSVSNRVAKSISDISDALYEATDEEALAALFIANDKAALEAMEVKLGEASPHLIRVRLLERGRKRTDYETLPPLTYAGLALIAVGEKSGEAVPAEAILFGEEGEHISLTRPVNDGDGNVVGHVFGAVDVKVVQTALKDVQVAGDFVEVQQTVSKGAPLVIGKNGSQGARVGVASIKSKIPGTAWQAAYWIKGSDTGESPFATVPKWMLGAGGGGVVLLAAAMVMMLRRRRGGGDDEEDEGLDDLALAKASTIKAVRKKSAAVAPALGTEGAIEVGEQNKAPTASSDAASSDAVEVPASIFRAYDVRGIVGKTLTAEIVREIGRAIGSEAYDRAQQTLVVGRDGRTSGPELAQALIEGLRASGRDVIDVGMVPTPVLYFATHYLNTGSGVMVTGSHNPSDYNGLKIMLGSETLFGDDILALKKRIDDGELSSGQGNLQSMDVSADYIRRVSEDVPVALGNAFKVVIDCGNGVAGDIAPKLIRALGHDVVALYCEIDGKFPNHHPDPSKPENLADLIKAVEENDADIGFAFDGDGDRLGVVDKTGQIIWPDRQMMLYARDVISHNPGAQIVYDVKCSSLLRRVIKKLGGKPIMWKTGHSFIKGKLKETKAELAGEMSGHIFFADRWYGFDDALYAAARMLEILMAFKQPPADVFKKLPSAFNTPELRVDMEEGHHFALMKGLANTDLEFDGGKVTTIDGIRVDYPDGWGLVRASNTEPSLVLRFEGNDERALERIKELFRKVLLDQKSDLSLPF